MSLMSVAWTLFRFHGISYKFELYSILCKGGELFKFIEKFRYLGMEDLPLEFLAENSSINMEFPENETEEITTGAYLISSSEIVNGVQKIGAGFYLLSAIII